MFRWCRQVVYHVNSGSEANDLAIRIAQVARPHATHFAIMGGGYHGHTAAVLDLSPYKWAAAGGSGQPAHIHVLPAPDIYRCRPRKQQYFILPYFPCT